MADDVDLRGLGVELHRSYDWVRKHWRGLVAQRGLPAPFIGGGGRERPWWSREAVRAWKQGGAGTGRLAQPHAPAAPTIANEDAPSSPAAGGLRAQLLAAAGGHS